MNVEVENCNDDNVVATLSFHVYSKMLLKAAKVMFGPKKIC